jgi:hypothetical protein
VNWFEKMCRDLGLMVHNMTHHEDPQRKVIKKEVEQEDRGNMILRRTTIEEVEVKRDRKTPD